MHDTEFKENIRKFRSDKHAENNRFVHFKQKIH
jgi:hypothetical protein